MTIKLQEFVEKKNELERQISEHGKTALLEGFAAMFAACPTILAVRWRQFTPYFNDGEPCVFRVRDAYYKFAGRPEDVGDYDDGFEQPWRRGSDPEENLRAEAVEVAETFGLFKRELYDILNASFGDGVKVTVTRDLQAEAEFYDHD